MCTTAVTMESCLCLADSRDVYYSSAELDTSGTPGMRRLESPLLPSLQILSPQTIRGPNSSQMIAASKTRACCRAVVCLRVGSEVSDNEMDCTLKPPWPKPHCNHPEPMLYFMTARTPLFRSTPRLRVATKFRHCLG